MWESPGWSGFLNKPLLGCFFGGNLENVIPDYEGLKGKMTVFKKW